MLGHAMVIVYRQADLLEIVRALNAGGGLAHLLDRRQQEPDQDRDDRDHHQQLDQGEGATHFKPSHLWFLDGERGSNYDFARRPDSKLTAPTRQEKNERKMRIPCGLPRAGLAASVAARSGDRATTGGPSAAAPVWASRSVAVRL